MNVRTIGLGWVGKFVWLGAIIVGLLVVLAFCIFYLSNSHSYLVDWFVRLHPDFYRHSFFTDEFFTPSVKNIGDRYCYIALALLCAAIVYIVRQFKKAFQPEFSFHLKASIADSITALILLGYCFGMWAYGNNHARPAFDEVFSAQNVANIHPFQGVSYYMLPNNHLLFNLLNNLCSPTNTDKVFSGRVLSLASYCIFTLMIFLGAKLLKFSRILSLLIALLAASQFFAWGFAFQARGYELYLAAECILLFSTFSYLATGRTKWLRLYVGAMTVGYFCMPTFLYMHVGSVVFFTLYQLSFRLQDIKFWLYQAIGLCVVFLCYLPALCFSGQNAIVNNHYVAPMATYKTVSAFCIWMFPFVQNYLPHVLSISAKGGELYNAFVCAPLLLLLAPKKSWHFLAGLCYLSVWVTLLAFIIAMKRVPFERNLIGHYSLTMLALVALVHWLSGLILKKKTGLAQAILAPIIVGGISISLLNNQQLIGETLYEYNVNNVHDQLSSELNKIPRETTVGCSEEGFYYAYLCKELGIKAKMSNKGNEAFFIKHESEMMPDSLAVRYKLESNTNGMEVYRLSQ